MDLALIAVVLALVLGHVAPGLGSVRRYGWFIGWLHWLGRVFAGQGAWQGRLGLLLAVGVPVLAVGAVQWLLDERWYGLPLFAFALAANFDGVLAAWRDWHANGGLRLDIGFLGAAARASVVCELAEEDAYAIDGPAQAPALLELRDAMSLVWRVLLLWLAVLAIFVVAGFVN